MPVPLEPGYPSRLRLKPGDVLMVHQTIKDRVSGDEFTWRHFAAVTRARSEFIAIIVLDEKDRKERNITLYDDKITVYYLPEEEWPDGVHAFRTRLILEGKLDAAVFS